MSQENKDISKKQTKESHIIAKCVGYSVLLNVLILIFVFALVSINRASIFGLFAYQYEVVKGDIAGIEPPMPFLGVRYISVGMLPEWRSVSAGHGALVTADPAGLPAVLSDSPAAHAGLKVGDVILAVAGDPLLEKRELSKRIRMLGIGTPIDLLVLRDGKKRHLRATIGEMPEMLAKKVEKRRRGCDE